MKKNIYLLKILSSRYCRFVFLLSLVLSFFLLPRGVFAGSHTYIAVIFMVVFSFSVTCLVRNIKEKIVLARTYKTSVFSLIMSILGFSAFQVCGINAGVCTATFGMGVVGAIFPSFFIGFLSEYGHLIIWFSVILQFVALYFMNCFKEKECDN